VRYRSHATLPVDERRENPITRLTTRGSNHVVCVTDDPEYSTANMVIRETVGHAMRRYGEKEPRQATRTGYVCASYTILL